MGSIVFVDGLNRGRTFDYLNASGMEAIGTNALQVVFLTYNDVRVEVDGQIIADKVRGRSDETLKSNIRDIKNATETLKHLTGKMYNYKESTQDSYGLIAQEVEKVLPSIVEMDKENIRSVSYIELIPIIIESIKEIDSKLETVLSLCKSGSQV
jgi:hypothetical protein